MRFLVAAIILLSVGAVGAFGQSTEKNVDRLQASCGRSNQTFDVHNSKQIPEFKTEPGKAQLIIIEQFDKQPGELAHPTLRIGMDGSWIGATRDNSYFPFAVDPGSHSLCIQWQSSFARISQIAAFTQLNIEAGKTYYYRATVKYPPSSGGTNMRLALDPLDVPEGEYLVKINPMSISKPK